MKLQFGLLALITSVATVSMPVSLTTQEGMSRLNFPTSFSTSKVLAQTTEDRKAEADRFLQQGIEQLQASQFQEAIQSWQESLVIYRKIGDMQGEANSLGNLGTVYDSLRQYQKAIQFHQQSLAIFVEIGNRKGEIASLINLGNAYFSLGQYQKAIEFDQQSLAIYRAIGDRHGEGNSLRILGVVYKSLGQYQKSIEFYQQSLTIKREIGDRQGEADCLNNLGNAYYLLGQYQKTIEFHQQALAIFKEIGDNSGKASSLANLGLTYYNLGQYQRAIEFHQQALAIFRKIEDRKGEASSLANLGLTYHEFGQYQKTIEFHQQALAIFRKIGDRKGEAFSLEGLGNAYNSLGQYRKSIEFHHQSLILAREIGYKAGESTSLGDLGIAYSALGQSQKAIKFYQQSLTIKREIGYRQGEVDSLVNLGIEYSSLEQYQKAIELYQQSLAIYRAMGDRQGEGTSLGNLGYAYNLLGQYQKAIALYQKSIAILNEIGDRQGELVFFNGLGLAYNYLKQYADAERSLFNSIEIGESLRHSQLSDADKISFFDTQISTYGLLQRTLVAQSKTNAALEIAERGRARAFIELLASRLSSQADTQLTITPQNALQLQQIAATHNATLIQYSIIQDPIKVQGKQKWRESRLFIWVIPPAGRIIFRWIDLKPLLKNTSLYNLVSNSKSIAPVNPDSSTVVTTSPELESKLSTSWHNFTVIILLNISGISLIGLAVWSGQFLRTKRAVQPHKAKRRWLVPSVFLTLAISSSGGLVFLINRTQTIVQNPSPKNDSLLAQFVSNTRASVSERETLFQKLLRGLGIVPKGQQTSQNEQLQQLHQILIDPIADLLPTDPNSPVIFIPQNSLFLVPFPALKDKNGKYLIEKHTILTAPSIQTLDLTHKQRLRNEESGIGNGEALIVGNPTMPSVPPQIGEPPQQLPSLPGAYQEAKAIAKLLNTQAITGNQATKSAILKKMPSARIIHLATHGILDEQRGLGSAIALAPNPNSQNKIGEVNGLLTAEEILDLKLNASLVVLSACDTGRGRITGDGVVGLSRSLISAGVPSVLVSLWSVPDAPTASLMTQFYRNWQHNPDKAQALRQAMLTTMKQHPNPRDWAAFTLIGEAE